MICVSCMNAWSLSLELEKRNVSLHAYIDPLAKHPINLRISVQTLKVLCSTFLLVCFVCLKESTDETRKNVFYFTFKALFALEIIKF